MQKYRAREIAFGPARDVALDAVKIGPQLAQRFIDALELLGVRVTLMRDEGAFADRL